MWATKTWRSSPRQRKRYAPRCSPTRLRRAGGR
jgi:hypothetical protein